MQASNDYVYITKASELTALCAQLRGEAWLALDTEFMRERTYFPELCLLQIATPDVTACIDPLTVDPLTELLDLLYDSSITKVMHASRQDLEIFYHMRGAVPAPVFDTQIAAPLLGYPDQMGYATLVHEMLGVRLDKAHTRTDWSNRPLTEAQLHYAADDARYLAQLYPRLRDALEKHGRLDWLSDDLRRLADSAQYAVDAEHAWRRIKGAERLRSRQRCVLRKLAAWREQTAVQENRPRNWLVRDATLVDIARMMPETIEQLAQLRGFPEKLVSRYGPALVGLIKQARLESGESEQQVAARAPRLEPAQEAVVDAMTAIVRLHSIKEHLNPSAIATRAELVRVMHGEPLETVFTGWKHTLIGSELAQFLAGESALQVKEGTLLLRGSQ